MAFIDSVTLDAADPTAADRFYRVAFGLHTQVRVRASDAASTGFRGCTLPGIVSQPSTVDASSAAPSTRAPHR